MILKVIIEEIVLGILLILICAFGIRYGAVGNYDDIYTLR